MVRRMLVRATTKAYNQLVAELISQLRTSDRARCGDVVERFLANQKGTSRYWPDDDEVLRESFHSFRPIVVSAEGGCGWCWRRSRTTCGLDWETRPR